MSERLVDIGTGAMFVRDTGAGFPLLFAHSLSFDGDMWSAQAEFLHDRYRVLAIDLRGHGSSGSPPGPYELHMFADDVARLLDALDIERVGYCGLSLGGMVGMQLALRHPDRVAALALMNTSAEPEDPAKRQLFFDFNERARNRPADPNAVGFLLSLMFSETYRSSNPDAMKAYAGKLDHPTHDGMYWRARAVIERDSILEQLGGVVAPTLVITSDRDTAIPAARGAAIGEAIPGATRLSLDGAGHMTAVEKPHEVNAALAEFFGSTLSERAK